MSFEEQIMFKDKHTSIFLHHMEAIVVNIFQIFLTCGEKCLGTAYCLLRTLI